MFTGIVEEMGRVEVLERAEDGARLVLTAAESADGTRVGDSIAVNGCCLTIARMDGARLEFDLLAETLDRTNLGALAAGSPVNLERALRADARLGGHFVQGHIDCAAEVVGFERRGADHRLEVTLPPSFAHYAAFKGSIAVNGVSLTIAELKQASFVTWLIPHTCEITNLGALAPGDRVNLEFDLLAKYLERMIDAREITAPGAG